MPNSQLSYQLDTPPSRALRGNHPKSFAQLTMKKRLPLTLTNVIDEIHQAFCELDPKEFGKKIEQGKFIVHQLAKLRHMLQRDKPAYFVDDTLGDAKLWQLAQSELEPDCEYTYHSLTWLFSECLVYRNLYSFIQTSSEWKKYDPFRTQKVNSFNNAQRGVEELTLRMASLMNKEPLEENQAKAMLVEMVQLSLWGNRADLSLINDITKQNDFHQFSNLSTEALASSRDNILADDTSKVWSYITTLRDQRVDIVLDNAGFELLTDLIFADWLLLQGYAKTIHFHGKAIPWFVSDTMLYDFEYVINACAEHECIEVQSFGKRWQEYYLGKEGQRPQWYFHDHYFWTTPYPYWHLAQVAPELHSDLTQSSLLIFKGDLNYRKLVYDCDWPVTTPFSKAIGPLASSTWSRAPSYPPVLALRTAKADPIAGLEGGDNRALDLDATDPGWRISGKYALIQFHRN